MEIVLIIILLIIIGVLIAMYLDGYWSVKSNEVISKETYNQSVREHSQAEWIPKGRFTKVTHKITYRSGRIKYKTYTFES